MRCRPALTKAPTAHRLEEGELEAAELNVAAIADLCAGIEGLPEPCSPGPLNPADDEDRLTDEQLEMEGATASPVSIALPQNWYQELLVEGVDPTQPGIYEWRIEGAGAYIGQYTHASRPRRAYGRNVANILDGRAYRKGKPDEFRSVHRALAQAVREGRRITLSLIENVADKPSRNRRERELIALRRQEAAHGGLPVLNAD